MSTNTFFPILLYHHQASASSSSSSTGFALGKDSLMRWLMKSSVKSRPCPVVSLVLKTCIRESPALRRILQTPSSSMAERSPVVCDAESHASQHIIITFVSLFK